jgi:hypothetical protein
VEGYWEEWGGKDPKVDFDTIAVGIGPHGIGPHGIGPHGIGPHGIGPHGIGPHGIGPHGITAPVISSLSEALSGTSMNTRIGSDTTITQSGATNVDLNLPQSNAGHTRSKSDPTPSHVGLTSNKRSLDDDEAE